MRVWLALAVSTLAVALYWPSLSGGLVFDDYHLLEYHPRVATLTVRDAFTTEFWGEDLAPWRSMRYRPLALLAYAGIYRTFGLETVAFHLCDVLLNGAAVFFLWILLEGAGFSRRVTAIAVCLFAVNPLHVSAVAWITGMIETLMTALCFASLACFVRGHRVAGVVLAAAAMLVKESAFVLPAIVFLLEWRRASNDRANEVLKRAEIAALPYFIPVIACLAARGAVLPRMPEDLQTSFLDRLPVMAGVAAAYLRMLVWPWPLSIAYAIPGAGAITLAMLAAAAAAVLLLLLRARDPESFPDLALAAGLAVLPMLAPIAGSPLMTQSLQIEDHYMFLSTAGACLLVALILAKLILAKWPRAGVAIAVIVIAAGVYGTLRQERTWQSSETMWRHTLEITPQSQFASVSLARDLAREGRFGDAVQVCEQALTYHPGSEVLRSFIVRVRRLDAMAQRVRNPQTRIKITQNGKN